METSDKESYEKELEFISNPGFCDLQKAINYVMKIDTPKAWNKLLGRNDLSPLETIGYTRAIDSDESWEIALSKKSVQDFLKSLGLNELFIFAEMINRQIFWQKVSNISNFAI